MCGVIGLVYERARADLGQIAAELLRTLEYRGYDSTGAALQGEQVEVRLRKGVGAPSVMVHRLGIVDEPGAVLCGQVRWATFGAVTDENAQPHVVRCKTFIYGAHNGNVTNCHELSEWLKSEGHAVLSDNDGEMVVHTVEHYFELELSALSAEQREQPDARRVAMRAAILRAAARLKGSYAAVIVDPVTRVLWGIKQGSSFYFGIGKDAVGGPFGIASSDLSAVLKLTRVLVPLAEGECVEFEPGGHRVFAVRDGRTPGKDGKAFAAGEVLPRDPVRSRLRAKDAALRPPFTTFMDQEIASQEATSREVVRLFRGGSEASRLLTPFIDGIPEAEQHQIATQLEAMRDQATDDALASGFREVLGRPALRAALGAVPRELQERGTAGTNEAIAEKLVSSEAGMLADLLPIAREPLERLAVRLLDVLLEREESRELRASVDAMLDAVQDSLARGGRIYVVCCGSSYHAAKAASLFFNELAHVQVQAVLPGAFRGEYSRSLRDGDLFVAVSQSGETKDLIDVLNDVVQTGLDIKRIGLVNNVNSTLAQEKSDVVIPLRCGPEIAVPATKSFINQLTVFYCLALELAERRLAAGQLEGGEARAKELARRRERLPALPALIRETVDSTDGAVEQAAQLLYLCPSLHLLATRIIPVAMEGALKVREIVLNHAEGIEGSEFKHGPNTILGYNTVLGPQQVERLLGRLGRALGAMAAEGARGGLEPEALRELVHAGAEAIFAPRAGSFALGDKERALVDSTLERGAVLGELYQDYPLVYITGPDERDVALTISQINTHKIRGAMTLVIAEEHPSLRDAAAKAPASNPGYRWVYVPLPRTNDTLMVVFSATIALQRLALKMSIHKAHYLDGLGIEDHGVHPDVPKNVSKSITVD